jgi:hypothetical protein
MYFSFVQNVATGSGDHQATYLMCTGVRRPGNEPDHRIPSDHEVQKDWNVPTLVLIQDDQKVTVHLMITVKKHAKIF